MTNDCGLKQAATEKERKRQMGRGKKCIHQKLHVDSKERRVGFQCWLDVSI